ncbi:hypothetical protein T484DRAFT_1821378, partial [Baffinella frigidus]
VVVNAYRKGGKKMDEHLAIFYAVELLRAVGFRSGGKKMDEHLAIFYAVELLRAVGSRSGCKKMDEQPAIFVELLRAVEAVHEAGFLHGDLKPDNVLVRDDAPEE